MRAMAPSKLTSAAAAAAAVGDGDLVFLGGAGLSRKPVALVRALVAAGRRGLRLVTFIGGPDVELLLRAGAVAEIHAAAVGLDHLGMAPAYRAAREGGTVRCFDYSEGMLLAGLEAGARRLPMMPVRAGIGTSLLEFNPHLRAFEAPFSSEPLVAVQAFRPRVALLHAPEAAADGRVRMPGDRLLDPVGAQASDACFVSCDAVVDLGPGGGDIHRAWVTGVVAAAGGAAPTACYPAYGLDAAAVKAEFLV